MLNMSQEQVSKNVRSLKVNTLTPTILNSQKAKEKKSKKAKKHLLRYNNRNLNNKIICVSVFPYWK